VVSQKHCFVYVAAVALGVMLTSGCATARHCHTEELPGVNIHCCASDLCNSATRWRTTTLMPMCSLTFALLLQSGILSTKWLRTSNSTAKSRQLRLDLRHKGVYLENIIIQYLCEHSLWSILLCVCSCLYYIVWTKQPV